MSGLIKSFASSSRPLLRAATRVSRSLSTLPSDTTLGSTAPASELSDSPLPAAYRSPTPNNPLKSPTTTAPVFTSPTTSTQRATSSHAVNPYKLHVFATRNNTILTLTHRPANKNDLPSDPDFPVAWVSAGSSGYKGAARGTYDAAVEASLRMFQKISDLIDPPIGSGGQRRKVKSPKPSDLEVVWKGFGQGREAVFRSLMGGEGDKIRYLVQRVTDAVSAGFFPSFFFGRARADREWFPKTPLKVGGTRAKKRRVYVTGPPIKQCDVYALLMLSSPAEFRSSDGCRRGGGGGGGGGGRKGKHRSRRRRDSGPRGHSFFWAKGVIPRWKKPYLHDRWAPPPCAPVRSATGNRGGVGRESFCSVFALLFTFRRV